MSYFKISKLMFLFAPLLFGTFLFSDQLPAQELKILALGDSLTEGFGVEKEEAYPYLLEQALMEKGYTQIRVINAGISGSTSASAVSRLKWYLRAKPKIMILALGANDGLRGLSVENMKKNLGSVIELAQSKNIRILLAGMQMPLNYGKSYTDSFKNAYFELAEQYNTGIIPFLLKDVGAVPEHNLEDGIHPNQEGHRILTRNVMEHLLPILESDN
ncbi:MAG: arylesterase [SAR324 cluster bacterium]|jgi:acyl-CoA thioesterase-1|nr:arylesterase [SAR324 cluster bacterium]MEE1575608.1 arylesterase [Deltaproteobacteria bacterium]MDP7138596.1 arylesterase [SAR324 cluster bacterium]MDP7334208.1 arylesterase [SAR324 cluster bacterium]MDP7500539.1 arylesterase [SAR324 cluster bacterium]|tara:strand:+ start:2703 stop:3350 length:648 start_codon:yes stop_codon:yes gene_type:complete